jgi:transcriptional regulator with GAF, ATPase, and Fis domain
VSARGPVALSASMREVLSAVEDVAFANTTVLLLGESGTGKEVLARLIHRLSPRANAPWVAVNCAALPAELLESELFGHERGAFTGAADRRTGKVELADKGTLLLDEISELPLNLQAKLLRVLQEREVDRVGGARPVAVDVRVIATSNRDLAEMVARKQFRADLYYRLCVYPILLPPLRDRLEDVPPLAQHLLTEIAARIGRPAPELAPGALECLQAYAYPGNVRELANILERALVRCRSPRLGAEHLDPSLRAAPVKPAVHVDIQPGDGLPPGLPIELDALERLAITEALRRVGGNRTHAARLLGISLRTLRNKLRAWRAQAALSADGQTLPGDEEGDAGSVEADGLARASQEESAA